MRNERCLDLAPNKGNVNAKLCCLFDQRVLWSMALSGETNKRNVSGNSKVFCLKFKEKKTFGPVGLARNLLLWFNTDEQNYFNSRMQPLFLLVWQGYGPLQGGQAPRYCGNTEQDQTQNLWYYYTNERNTNYLVKQKWKILKMERLKLVNTDSIKTQKTANVFKMLLLYYFSLK